MRRANLGRRADGGRAGGGDGGALFHLPRWGTTSHRPCDGENERRRGRRPSLEIIRPWQVLYDYEVFAYYGACQAILEVLSRQRRHGNPNSHGIDDGSNSH